VSAFFEDSTICVSNAIRDALLRDYRFPAHRTITIYNGVSLSEFNLPLDQRNDNGSRLRSILGISPQDFLLVCVARLSEQKQLDILLSAVSRAVRSDVCCKCVILGDGPLRKELEQQALSLNLPGIVFFEGYREDVRPYLQAGSAFVLTSQREGLPISILEAMACGLPCIVTRVGGNPEVVTHGVDGIVVSPGSVEEVAEAISYLSTHPKERAEMSRMARKRVCESFDIEDRMTEIKRAILN
jgi:glycosyltransferase involved in cell wall biosynthesis